MENDPLLRRSSVMAGVVDFLGRPIARSSSGRWTSALFIIGVEIAERIAYYGISFNLISYLTGSLGFSTAAAAATVNTWSGTSMLLPLLGALVADSFIGRYRTIVLASLLYFLGLGLLTVSAMLPSRFLSESNDAASFRNFQVALFFFSLYLVAFAQGGHKPCVQAFGADQFDENDDEERIARSSFFNWWYFGMNGGMIVAIIGLSYIQELIGWALGFGIPCVVMGIALAVFLLGSWNYRCYPLKDSSPSVRIGRSVASLISRRNGNQNSKIAEEQTEEAKGVLRLFPIWATCLSYAIVFSQTATLFNKQCATMDRWITLTIQVPSAAFQSIISIVIVAFIPVYDRLLVPLARNLSGFSSGITQLQRIGAGLVFSVIAMVVAALVEKKRLETAKDHGLLDDPNSTVPMSILWLLPQYVLFGIMEVFGMVGLQEFFYDQVPDALRSLGLALYLGIFGIGSFISGLLVSEIDQVTISGGDSWFSDNLNRAHLDYFYWLLAAIGVVALVLFLCIAHGYVYKKKIVV